MPPFDVFVNEDGEVYRYLINNATFEALIEIVKKDAETGKVIPAAGIGFKVRNGIADNPPALQEILEKYDEATIAHFKFQLEIYTH